jgi:hypothetical protein
VQFFTNKEKCNKIRNELAMESLEFIIFDHHKLRVTIPGQAGLQLTSTLQWGNQCPDKHWKITYKMPHQPPNTMNETLKLNKEDARVLWEPLEIVRWHEMVHGCVDGGKLPDYLEYAAASIHALVHATYQ